MTTASLPCSFAFRLKLNAVTIIFIGVFNGVIPETDLTALLAATGKFSERDLTEIVKFIKKCLTLDPAERPTADKLEGEPWLKSGFACSCGFCG